MLIIPILLFGVFPDALGDVLSRELERICGKCTAADTSAGASIAGTADEAFALVGPRIQ